MLDMCTLCASSNVLIRLNSIGWLTSIHTSKFNCLTAVCVSVCPHQEGSTDSLYEAVQSSSDRHPPPIPSRSSSRACSRSASRSCSPAVLLDDGTKWRGSGRSISMVSYMAAHVHVFRLREPTVGPCDHNHGPIVLGHVSEQLGLFDFQQADWNYKIKVIMKWWTEPVDSCMLLKPDNCFWPGVYIKCK